MPLLGIAGHRVLSLLDEFPFVAMNSPIVGYVGAGVRIPKPSLSGNQKGTREKLKNQAFTRAIPVGVLEGCGFDAWSLPLGSRLVGPAILNECN